MILWRLVSPIAVAACASLAAVSASNLLEANHLADTAAISSARVAHASPVPKERVLHTKNAKPLAERNMFCSACTPQVATAAPVSILTKRPLRLVATNLADRHENSFAAIINTYSHRQGAYQIGSRIPDAGIIESITRAHVDFRNDELALERIAFAPGKLDTVAPSKAATARGGSLADEYVRVVDATHVQVDRELVEKIQGNPRLAGARFRPVYRAGKLNGVKLFAVRTNSIAHKLGLRNGDAIVEVNSVRLDSLEAGLELMGELHTRDQWSFDIIRRGKPVSLSVELR